MPSRSCKVSSRSSQKLVTVAKYNIVDEKAAPKQTNGNGIEAEESGDEGEDENEAADGGATGAAKKKRKRKPKKKKAAAPTQQSNPPRVLLSNLFPNNSYPVGQEVPYVRENTYRTTSEEKRHLDRMNNDFLAEYRYGAEVHRQVRQAAQKHIQPGQTLTEICEYIEDSVRALTGHPGLEEGDNIKGGVAFPTGVNLDHIAAHYSPNAGNKTVLAKENVMKVDFGVHVNGRIVDSAFTMSFDHTYDKLLEAVKAATETGVKEAGIDVRMSDIGAAIQETMESYEGEVGSKTYPVKAIRNLNGHDILQWKIHGGKSVPIVKGNDQTKMEEGEVFAIETFGSTGNGYVRDDVRRFHGLQRKPANNINSMNAHTMHGFQTRQRSISGYRQLRTSCESLTRASGLYHSAGDILIDWAKTSIF